MDYKETHTIIPELDIDFSKLKIPCNWVWVKLDDDFEYYHNTDTGLNTGISVAPYGINQASHVAVTGTIVALPERLQFNGYRTAKMKRDALKSDVDQQKIAALRRQSVAYYVPMEIPVGCKVYFEYTSRLNALKEGRIYENNTGRYMVIPYDLLVMAFRPGADLNALKIQDMYMLNGFVLIKVLEYATQSAGQGLPKGITDENDIFIPAASDAKYVHRNNVWYANILSAGCAVKAYADFPDRGDEIDGRDQYCRPGVKIAFDGRQKKRLENTQHRVIFKTHELFRIHRKDILSYFPNGKII